MLVYRPVYLVYRPVHLVYCPVHLVYCPVHLVYRPVHLMYRPVHLVYRPLHLVYCSVHLAYRPVLTYIVYMYTEAECKELELRLKFKPRLKYGWYHLNLYSIFLRFKPALN